MVSKASHLNASVCSLLNTVDFEGMQTNSMYLLQDQPEIENCLVYSYLPPATELTEFLIIIYGSKSTKFYPRLGEKSKKFKAILEKVGLKCGLVNVKGPGLPEANALSNFNKSLKNSK